MNKPIPAMAALREQIKASRDSFPHHWEASRKLVVPDTFRQRLPILIRHIQAVILDPSLRDQLIDALQQFGQSTKSREGNHLLKSLTGLPPSKAVRALLVWGVLAVEREGHVPESLSPGQLEDLLRQSTNPYDVLRHTATPSVLDIGAGDLSFEQELVDQYVQYFRAQHLPLTVHAFDRLKPGSRVGGVYHKNQEREQYLRKFPPEEVRFKFWGDMSLDGFSTVKGRLSHYTVSTCHAPANPTFAYEPSRLTPEIIRAHLVTSRGQYRLSRYEGEPVLEVSHRGKTLTFPDWKFDIVGPLALLRFIARQSAVGILSAIDDEVFWEMLSQLLADDRYRPADVIFFKHLLPDIFGTVYKELSSMAVGERKELSGLADLRNPMPFECAKKVDTHMPSRLRYVEVRRGAVLDGVPGSFTARQFSQMKEESIPWWIIMVPDY